MKFSVHSENCTLSIKRIEYLENGCEFSFYIHTTVEQQGKNICFGLASEGKCWCKIVNWKQK